MRFKYRSGVVHVALVVLLLMAHGCHPAVAVDSRIQVIGREDRPRILFIGSSSIAYWTTMSDDFAGVPGTIIRHGIGGRTLEDVTAHTADQIIDQRPDKVFVYGGSIDMHQRHRTAPQTFKSWVSLCDQVHAALPRTTVYFISCKPSVAKWEGIELEEQLNAYVKAMAARDKRVVYIDVWNPMLDGDSKPIVRYFRNDMNHLSQEGYDLWTAIIRPYLVDRPAMLTAMAAASR
jgi:lysophospholipase L1-like esterase